MWRKEMVRMLFFPLMISSLFFSCVSSNGKGPDNGEGMCRAVDTGAAVLEMPSLELVLDRLNSSGAALKLVNVILKDMAISDTAEWPARLNDFSPENMDYLSMDGMYASHGGQVPCAKKHVMALQELIFKLPPDMYAMSGDFYKKGESTILNGKYYKVISHKKIITKENPSIQQLKDGVDSAIKHMTQRNKIGQVEKRSGILRGVQIKGRRYDNLMDAVCAISPNGKKIYDAFERRNAAKERYEEQVEELRELGKESGGKNSEEVNILKEKLEKDEKALEEANNILIEELDNINKNVGCVSDPVSVQVLKNVSTACAGTSGLLWDSISLTTIALGKITQGVLQGYSLSSELQAIKNPQQQSIVGQMTSMFSGLGNKKKKAPQCQTLAPLEIMIPLRIARLEANAENLLDSLNAIKNMLLEDRKLINKIQEKAELLIHPDAVAEVAENKQGNPPEASAPAADTPRRAGSNEIYYKRIQENLTRLNYPPGPIDGKPGAKTRRAVTAFQKDFGYPRNGRLNGEFLMVSTYAHELQSSGTNVAAEPGVVLQFFKDCQNSLKKAGYYKGAVDGRPGDGTCGAVKRFQDQGGYSGSPGLSEEDKERIRQLGILCSENNF